MKDALLARLRLLAEYEIGPEQAEIRSFSLDEGERMWVVVEGHVDIFAVLGQEGKGRRHHVWRVERGQVVLPLQEATPREVKVEWRGILAPGTRVLCCSAHEVWDGWDREPDMFVEMLSAIESWVETLSRILQNSRVPTVHTVLSVGVGEGGVTVASGRALYPPPTVRWVWQSGGRWQLAGEKEAVFATEAGLLPAAPWLWYRALSGVRVRRVESLQPQDVSAIRAALQSIHAGMVAFVAKHIEQAEQQEQEQFAESQQWRQHQAKQAISALSETYKAEDAGQEISDAGPDPLFAACQRIGRYLGVEMQQVSSKGPSVAVGSSAAKGGQKVGGERMTERERMERLERIAQASSCVVRAVQLQGDWWMDTTEPLLGFMQDSGDPVALLPTPTGRMMWYDPNVPKPRYVESGAETHLEPVAYVVSRVWPATQIRGYDLLSLGLRQCRQEWRVVLLLGLVGGLLTLLLPTAARLCFDTIVPGREGYQLALLAVVLITTCLVLFVVQGVRGVALVRIEGKVDASLQTALWDRLLRLPVSFYQGYESADLALRSVGVHTIRQVLSGSVVSAMLDAAFAGLHLALLFYYHGPLAWVSCGVLLVVLLFGVGVSWRLLPAQRDFLAWHGKVASTTFQLLRGIEKLRVAGAESAAYAVWAQEVASEKQRYVRTRRLSLRLVVFHQVVPMVATVAFFGTIGTFSATMPVDVGTWIAFLASFAIMMASALSINRTLFDVVSMFPTWERITPILRTLPETADIRTEPGVLRGEIEISHVAFRYERDTPYVLEDVSLQIRAGQFVAIVGASGSGKSTLFRLLLGFDEPETGSIYYDHQDIRHLDIQRVRRQIGVVLQQGHWLPGSLFSNIASREDMTLDDAWNAAHLAGFAEDIKQMPMGMNTLVPEGGEGFSGGQRQRMLIARALARKPRMLFFDEATSALDEHAQAQIIRSLESLQMTRVVIAHRLSTIQGADQIFVLENGRLVEQGTFDELIERQGVFAKLARVDSTNQDVG